MSTHFDLIAIGGGSGGLAVAERAAQHGKAVAVVEAAKIGGTCVNTGCVPKKVMWYAAHLAHAADDANAFGIPTRRGKTDWSKLVRGRDQYVANINAFWDGHVQQNGITRINGPARFVDARSIEVNGEIYSANHIVVATGGKPVIPKVPGAELGISSEGFFELERQPANVAIIGGGYIGVELAGVLRALGSEVTVVTQEDRLLEFFDTMISETLTSEMAQQGVHIHTNFQVAGLADTGSGIVVDSTGGDRVEGFDCVNWAVGRKPNTFDLNREAAGLVIRANWIVQSDVYHNSNLTGI